MTTDPFIEAAHTEAKRMFWDGVTRAHDMAMKEARGGFIAGARWARARLTAQEPTDAEVLAALNAQGVVVSPKMHPAPSLDYWGDRPAEAMSAALSAARAVRNGGGSHE